MTLVFVGARCRREHEVTFWGRLGPTGEDRQGFRSMAKFQEILEHWIDLNMDAFMLEYTGCYIGAGSGNLQMF